MIRSTRNSVKSKPGFRFKIWTRKSYSVFNSLGKQISIAFLSTSLSEKIGAKSKTSRKNLLEFIRRSLASENGPDTSPPPPPYDIEDIVLRLMAPVIFFLLPQIQEECCSGEGLFKPHSSVTYFLFKHFPTFSYIVSILPCVSLIVHNTGHSKNSNTFGPACQKAAKSEECIFHRPGLIITVDKYMIKKVYAVFVTSDISTSNYSLINNKPQFIYLNLINYEKIHGAINANSHVCSLCLFSK